MPSFRAAGLTDTGRRRSRNEDAFHVDAERGLAVVADGMGGHPAGDRASQLAVREVVARLGVADGRGAEDPAPTDTEDAPRTRDGDMEETVRAANRRILRDGQDHPERRGMGTTLTVLHADGKERRYRIGHVGDSRCYRFRDGALEPLTRDDTPLREEIESGRLTREEARLHPSSHMLSQALGATPGLEPHVDAGPLEAGDLFLLCTDGLLAVLSEAEIETVLRQGSPEDLEALARTLVERTLEGGAPDNVTVALLHAT